jgi:hypothetical protein
MTLTELPVLSTVKNLQTLNLTGSAITGVSIKTLLKHFPKLATLTVSDCSHISPDAVDWGRKKGLIIIDRPNVKDILFKSGRRVNYG